MQLALFAAFILFVFILYKVIKKRKQSTGKPQELVNVTSEHKGNQITFSVSLNEAELKRRIENGTLNEGAGKYERSLSEICGFYGQETSSPNGEFTACCADGHTENEKWKNGHLALVKGTTILFHKRLQRPNDAEVSNNGRVIICDWLNSNELTGKFMIFDQQGEILFSKKTTANLGNAVISPNGIYALFETYGSDTGHSNQFFIVDIEAKKVCAQFERPFNFRTAIINEVQKQVSMTDNRGFVYEIDFKGRQTNRADYEAQIWAKGAVLDKLRLYEEKTDTEKFRDPVYLGLLEEAVNDKDAGYSYGTDSLYRRIGEYYEASGDLPNTILYWEKALAVNPKVGVARKLDALKKKSNSPQPGD